jgi:deazaflavin-dependent oxidoreductase (nitroreductase family)
VPAFKSTGRSEPSLSARAAVPVDLRQRILGWVLRLANPLVRVMVPARLPTGAPNVLLTVRGRRSGALRTVPVGIVELNGRRFVQSSYGEGGWVKNLRVAGVATITDGNGQQQVQAIELSPDDAGRVLHEILEPFHRSRLLRILLGPGFRPPIAVLWRLRVRVDDTEEEYVAEARRHPLFEVRVISDSATP